jgi:putative Mg2+ transporter-C (MgtC) family protein
VDHLAIEVAVRASAAWITGAAIGLDRSYHDKPAGFRTYALVSLASSLLIMTMAYQDHWLTQLPAGTFQSDPMRIAQGILTGIGFLGAGTIFRERQAMRGLTTAASIWVAATLGILYGAGFYEAALIGTAIALATLILLRGLETRLPSFAHALHELHFTKDAAPAIGEVEAFLGRHGIEAGEISFHLRGGEADAAFEYHMTLRTKDPANFARLAETLRAAPNVKAFRISPTDD